MGDPPPTDGEFVTRCPMEVKTFVWRIEDLAKIVALDSWPSPDLSIQFDAGESIGTPSKWMVQIYPGRTGNQLTQIFLKLSCIENVVGMPINAACEAAIKSLNDPQSNKTVVSLRSGVETNFLKRDELTPALGEELTIHLKFEMCANPVSTGGKTSYVTKKMMEDAGPVDVAKSLGVLLETGFNSDFVIKVKKSESEVEWVEMKVHKAILGSRSRFFERMLDTEMTESKTGTLEIVDLSPNCMKLILKWIYSGFLNEDWKKVPEEMVKAGDKYGLDLLVQFLDQNLHLACNFENATNLREVAKLHGLVTATKNVTKFMAENLESILD